MSKYTTAQINDAKNRVKTFKTKNGRNPNTVKVGNDTLTWTEYTKLINTTTTTRYTNKIFTNKEYKQETNYYCGVNCIQLAISKLTGKWINEKTIASYCGTTTSGTSTDGMKTCLAKINKKYGTNLKLTLKNFSDLTWKQQGQYLSNPNTFLFYHLCYHNHSNGSYSTKGYGHYETLKEIRTDSNTLKVYNSLSGGYIDTRTKATQEKWCKQITQPSIIIITK